MITCKHECNILFVEHHITKMFISYVYSSPTPWISVYPSNSLGANRIVQTMLYTPSQFYSL